MLEVGNCRRVRIVPFVVLNIYSAYSTFLGRSTLSRAAIAPWCLTLKFSTKNDVGVVHEDQGLGHECYVVELREARRREKGKDAKGAFFIKNLDA